ncbi:MAG: hypothetical protein A2Y65_06125 [Deltaproteobacteria bacterium RBG_13_52_11]|nr:MAG: hypothetical protein A2Y65_06125 [Deltaproteobacteria bacterium RBG_13_52_11]
MRYLVIVIIAAMMMAASAPAYSHGGSRLEGEVSIEVTSESGSTLLFIPHKDFWEGGTHVVKRYLEARRGENYGIVIHNMTPERIGVVIAVDGRNIISGKKSDLKNNEAMYIVNSYDYGEYDGWRTAGDKVHKFYFTDMADSYAMRTFSDSTAMGVIAVAIYREKERPQPLYEQKRLDNIYPAPSAEGSMKGKMGAARDESAGTGFGDEQYSPTIRVAFEPENTPVQKTLFKYEWREVLCRKGILSCREEARNRLWDEDAYAPYPPGYLRN